MRRPSLRRAVQSAAVATLLASGAMLAMPSGAAAAGTVSAKVAVLQQAWFWQTAAEQANPPVAPPAAPPSEPSGVPDGDLAVASTSNDGSSSKQTLLSFDVSAIPHGSTISAFTFTLTLDSQPGATSFDTQGAAVVACQPTRLWPAEMPGDYTDAPSVDCPKKVKPDVNGSTYTFKIPVIAQSWLDDQNLGVAILADPVPNNPPFQLVFAGAKDVKAAVTYTSGTTTTAGGASSTPTVPTGTAGGGSVVPPPAPAGGPAPSVPDTTSAAPPAAAPVVAPANATAAPVTRPVAAAKTASAAPTKGFWLLVLVLALALLLASLALGDPMPVATPTQSSRLDQVLRSRNVEVLTVRNT